jgi:hypothetical protein
MNLNAIYCTVYSFDSIEKRESLESISKQNN